MPTLDFGDALNLALREEMRRDSRVYCIGEDIVLGVPFGVTKGLAGSGQIVAFGNRYELKPRLRNESEKPDRPDRYVVSVGLTKVRGNTDYAPVNGLLEFQR